MPALFFVNNFLFVCLLLVVVTVLNEKCVNNKTDMDLAPLNVEG